MRRCRVRTISRWRRFDPFGRGYAKYSFQNLCKEDRELYLKDGTEKIFYNCIADPEKVPENLRELYDYIRSGKVGGDLSRRIDEAVCMARKNEEWRSEYMKELLHDDDVREEGREEIRAELNQLTICLLNTKRYNDLERAAEDIEYQKKLLKEFGIE